MLLAGAHKKFYRIQHLEVYLLDLKVQFYHKIKLPLDMVSTSASLTIRFQKELIRQNTNI